MVWLPEKDCSLQRARTLEAAFSLMQSIMLCRLDMQIEVHGKVTVGCRSGRFCTLHDGRAYGGSNNHALSTFIQEFASEHDI